MKEFSLNVPTSLEGIKLKDYQKYLLLLEKNKDAEDSDFLNLKTLEVFCGLSVKDALKTPVSVFDSVLNHLGNLFTAPTPLIRQFTLKDPKGKEVTFGFIPDLHKMSYGEWIDAEKYCSDFNLMHKFMAVMYRPVTFQGKSDTYLIEEYKGTEHLSDIMLEAPLSVALGMQVFFWTLGIRLSKTTMGCILNQVSENQVDLETPSEESGELSNQLSNLPVEMLEELMRLPRFHYINV